MNLTIELLKKLTDEQTNTMNIALMILNDIDECYYNGTIIPTLNQIMKFRDKLVKIKGAILDLDGILFDINDNYILNILNELRDDIKILNRDIDDIFYNLKEMQ